MQPITKTEISMTPPPLLLDHPLRMRKKWSDDVSADVDLTEPRGSLLHPREMPVILDFYVAMLSLN